MILPTIRMCQVKCIGMALFIALFIALMKDVMLELFITTSSVC